MSRQAKLIIYGIVIVFSVYLKQTNKPKNVIDNSNTYNPPPREAEIKKPTLPPVPTNNDLFEKIDAIYERPENGFSPYDDYFGRGIYNNSLSNYVEIDNQTSNDAVVLLVNAYTDRKVRNEYVRKNTKFKMTGIPDGVYYLRMMMGNNWNPNKKTGPLKGTFARNLSVSGNSDSKDWMKIGTTYADSDGRYYQGFMQTLHPVAGGDVESENLTINEFIE